MRGSVRAVMAVIRKFCGLRKMLIFLQIHITCCGLIYTNVKNKSSVCTWQEFYVCSEVVKAKIFVNGFKRQQKVKLQPLANLFKLAPGCRLLLYFPTYFPEPIQDPSTMQFKSRIIIKQ